MTITKEDVERVIRGPADLEERIDQLTKQKKVTTISMPKGC